VCRWHGTYCWKTLNKGYNFASNLTSIGDLHTKLWAPKVVGVPILGISGLPLGSSRTKWHLSVGPVVRHKYYKGKVLASPPSPGHGESCESVLAHGSSEHQKCFSYALTNLLFGLCMFVWVIDYLSFFLIASQSSNTSLYPWSVMSQGGHPTSSSFIVFTFGLAIRSIRSLGVRQDR
jgi:hypothetical protein